MRSGGQTFVGPDNGVLWPAIAADPKSAVREIRGAAFRLPVVSDTFHGRDLFAPAAARLASGRPFASVGPLVRDAKRLPGFEAERHGGSLRGQVLRVDRFGNLVTSVTTRDLSMAFDDTPFPTLDIRVGGRRVDEAARTYGLARPGVPFALVGSGGRLEIALRDGSAAEALACGRGMPVTVERRGSRR